MATTHPLPGAVSAFDPEVGMGTVTGDDGRVWPFHCTRLADGTRVVDVGTRVVFLVGPGAPGRWEATSVVKLG